MPSKRQTEVDEEIEEFDFSTQLHEHGFYLVFGKRRSGKTTMMRLISQHTPFRSKYQHVVIAGNEGIKELWAEIVHPYWIHDCSISALRAIIREQQRRIRECKLAKVAFPEEWEVVLIIDDCGTYHDFMHCAEMKWLADNGRNSRLTVFLLVQKLTQAATSAREGADGVLSLFTAHAESIRKLHKEFASVIDFKLFQFYLAGATQNRGMFTINAHPETPTPIHMFGYSHSDFLHEDGYKGKLEHVGAEAHWEYAIEHYKSPESALMQKHCAAPVVEDNEEDSEEDEGDSESIATPQPVATESVSETTTTTTKQTQTTKPIGPGFAKPGECHFSGQDWHQGSFTLKFNRKQNLCYT